MIRCMVMMSLLRLAVVVTPPEVVAPDDVVFNIAFESLDSDARVIAAEAGSDVSLVGTVDGFCRLIDVGEGQALLLQDKARLSFDRPTSIDLRRGAASMDLALNFKPADAPEPVAVLWCLQGSGQRRYMARLYLLTSRSTLVFGVYLDGAWRLSIKAPINWRPGESHNVTVVWGEKTSLVVDGRIIAVARAEGLLTDALLPDAVDLTKARLFIGPETPRLLSDFTVSRFEIRNQPFRLAAESP